jgi:CheY-like chemotaxis protein
MKNNKMILIVDDNSENIKFLGNLLSKNGYETGIAQNGKKAEEFIKKEIPDLITP